MDKDIVLYTKGTCKLLLNYFKWFIIESTSIIIII